MGMTFIDFFAGIGGFRRGMELAGHRCVGFCEYDKYAVASYTSMHLVTGSQRDDLLKMDLKRSQKEVMREEYRNGEWYANDIRTVEAGSLPRADCWCFGFPCQDISIAGKQLGFSGRRSSLFFAVTGLIKDLEEESRPEVLFIENVKNLLSVNRGLDFAKLLIELDEIGYDAEWSVLNSKDFGVPQDRERVYIIGHLRGRSGKEIFYSIERSSEGRSHSPNRDDMQIKKQSTDLILPGNNFNQRKVVHLENGISRTLIGGGHSGNEPKVALLLKKNGKIDVEVRKLSCLECFRLQGWEDKYFYHAAMVNSDTQLYKQAANGVTVNVIRAIADRFD